MSRRRSLLSLWACLTFGLAIRAFVGAVVGDARGCPVEVAPVLVDLNQASVAELRALPGIGVVRAEAIVLERVRNGSFRKIEDLDHVDGLGPGTVEQLRPFARIGPSRR